MTVKDTSIDARDWSLLGLLSILWGGSFFFNGVVLKELPPFTVVFLRVMLAAIMLLVAVGVSAFAGDEKLCARRIAGVVAGLVGVIILQGSRLGLQSGQGLGILLCLAAAFSYGLSALLARRLLSNSPPLGTAT